VYLLFAIYRATTTCTITLLRSLADLGYVNTDSVPLLDLSMVNYLSFCSGGFDVPKSKCPPDRGSSDCVRGSPASSTCQTPIFHALLVTAYPKIATRAAFVNVRRHIVFPPTPPQSKTELPTPYTETSSNHKSPHSLSVDREMALSLITWLRHLLRPIHLTTVLHLSSRMMMPWNSHVAVSSRWLEGFTLRPQRDDIVT